jgi:tetratricopeptide (TPR) repeat protein
MQAGDRRGVAQCICCLGYCAFETADYQDARVLTERGIELQLELGIVPAYTRNTLGSILANLGDYEGSLSQYTQSYEWFLSSHNERGCAHCLHCIGGLLLSKGDTQVGLDRLQRSLKIFRALGDLHSAVTVLLDTAGALLDQGKVEMAVTASHECIALCCTLDSVLTSLRAIRQYAFILQATGRKAESAFLAIFSREKLLALKLASETSIECELEATFADALSSLSNDQRQRLLTRALESNIDSVLATIIDHDFQRGSVTSKLLQMDSAPL